MYIEVPTDHIDVIKDSNTCNGTDKSEGTIDRIENQLSGSVLII